MINSNNNKGVEQNDLIDEAIVFHNMIFKSEPKQEIINKYIAAHDIYINNASEKNLIWMKKALNLNLDFEALEMVLRFTNGRHILVRKIKILIYITESYPAYYNRFVNEVPQRAEAILSLGFHSLRSIYKLLKGLSLLLYYQNFVNNNA